MYLLGILTALICAHRALALTTGSPYTSSLAQHALQKVLHDASEIFGLPAPPSTRTNVSLSTWMSTYPDEALLTSLTIPGAHDAATWNYSGARQAALRPVTDLLNASLSDPRAYRCQRRSVAAALEAGVRFLDLRYAPDATGTRLVFWHRDALLGEAAGVEELLFAVFAWLRAHASEAVLLSLQYEGATRAGAANSAAVQRMLFDVLTSPAARSHLLQTRALGTLGEARGKAVVVRRFDMDQLPAEYEEALPGVHLSPAQWVDNSANITLVYNQSTGATAYIEDLYSPDSVPLSANASSNIAAKLEAVATHLHEAANGSEEDLFVTFASGQRLDAEIPVYPETMALGSGTKATPDGGVNQQLLPTLKELAGRRLGIVVLDFWDEPGALVEAVLGL
ncbi:hypothetical protein JX265_009650 [Neoarthrinium moseri]|uniref:Phosphatidylinositol-specific phospholipase C X domain-containing protein n=1 Tax=Neoarthrinium moseri TaxID=1658444 RepID=A0A9P9WFS4_9PEZI|nr:hypothetical protein JX265_009650 [Neoarthrinium moseri]